MNPPSKIFLLLFYSFIFYNGDSNCQVNLVPNPDFEEYYYCPDSISNLTDSPVAPDRCPKYWYDPTWKTSDYYNACSTLPQQTGIPQNFWGLQTTHSGNGFCGFGSTFGFGSWDQEYIAIHLASPLAPGQTYYVSFWLNLVDSVCYAHNMIGAYFSTDTIDTSDVVGSSLIYLVPQIKFTQIITDKVNWVLMKQSFVAAGGEQFMAIGVFDTTGIDTAFIPTNCFYPADYGSYYYIDDVVVSTQPDLYVIPENSDAIELHQNYSNPFYGNTIITYYLPENIKSAQLIFRNNLGQLIKVVDINDRGEGTLNIDGEDFKSGMYSYILMVDGAVYKTKKIIKE